MKHQDFKTVIFNNVNINDNKKKIQRSVTPMTSNEVIKVEADNKLGKLLSQARIAKGYKTQLDFIKELKQKTNINISLQIYSRWENNKEAPTNEQIAKMEKVLTVKLPRNKKIKVDD